MLNIFHYHYTLFTDEFNNTMAQFVIDKIFSKKRFAVIK